MNKKRNSPNRPTPQAPKKSSSVFDPVSRFSSEISRICNEYWNWLKYSPRKIQFIPIVILALILLFWFLVPAQDIYVSDIDEINVIDFEWKEPQRDQSIDGNSLLIDDKWYHKGLGVHANAEVSLAVPYGYTHFISEVGVDDEVAEDSPASVEFIVIGDGAVLHHTPVLEASMPPYRIYVNVEDISMLNLKVTNAGDTSNSDHADWGDARFVKK